MLGGEVGSLLKISALTAHRYGCFEIEFQLARGFDEGVQLARVFQLRITVQQQGSVICGRSFMIMQLL